MQLCKKSWAIGLDIQEDNVQAVTVQKCCYKWHLHQWWRNELPKETFRDSILIRPEALCQILTPWQRTLPKNYYLSIALPPALIMQDTVSPPKQLKLQAHDWYIKTLLPKLFPLSTNDLISDYRPLSNDHKQLLVTIVRRTTLETLVDTLNSISLFPNAIDINPYVLRNFIQKTQQKNQALLIHVQKKNVLVTTSLNSQYAFTTINTSTELFATVQRWCIATCATNINVILVSGEIEYLPPAPQGIDLRIYNPFQSFHTEKLSLPSHPEQFVLACGLATRMDIEDN